MPIRSLTVLLFAGMPLCLSGQIRGPMLGWVFDGAKESIRPVLGIAGSSVLGKGLELGAPVKQAAISGRQEFALLLAGENRAAMLVDLRPLEPSATPVGGVPEGANRLALSARGRAAVLRYDEAAKLVVVGGFPDAPSILREIDLSVEGIPALIAVTDDGSLVLAAYPDTSTVLIIDQDGNRVKLPRELAARSLAFRENSSDALIAATDGVYHIAGVAAGGSPTKLWDSESSAVAAFDAERVLLVDRGSQSVVEINVQTREFRVAQCPCDPTGLVRMTGADIYRLNEVSADPLWLLEIQESGLRTVFVPPDVADIAESQ